MIRPTKTSSATHPQFSDFMNMPSPRPWNSGLATLIPEIGAPQFGQLAAFEDTSRPHSEHFVSAISQSY